MSISSFKSPVTSAKNTKYRSSGYGTLQKFQSSSQNSISISNSSHKVNSFVSLHQQRQPKKIRFKLDPDLSQTQSQKSKSFIQTPSDSTKIKLDKKSKRALYKRSLVLNSSNKKAQTTKPNPHHKSTLQQDAYLKTSVLSDSVRSNHLH